VGRGRLRGRGRGREMAGLYDICGITSTRGRGGLAGCLYIICSVTGISLPRDPFVTLQLSSGHLCRDKREILCFFDEVLVFCRNIIPKLDSSAEVVSFSIVESLGGNLQVHYCPFLSHLFSLAQPQLSHKLITLCCFNCAFLTGSFIAVLSLPLPAIFRSSFRKSLSTILLP
jgi:hypothetical protein